MRGPDEVARHAVMRARRVWRCWCGLEMMLALVVSHDTGVELVVVELVHHRSDRRHAERNHEQARGSAHQPRRQTEESPHPDQSSGGPDEPSRFDRDARVRFCMLSIRDSARLVVCGVVALAALLSSSSPAWAQTAVILVRHAERADQSTDSLLSPAGSERAKALARALATAGVKQIFVTKFQRTQLTAAPLAAALKLTPEVVDAATSAPIVERIRRDHANDVVLVVGHSNTVPALIKDFGHPDPVTIADDEFDSLFILFPRGTAVPSVLRIRY
jgi:hypothetical protein